MGVKITDFDIIVFDINGTLVDNRWLYRKALLIFMNLGLGNNQSQDLFLPTGGIPLPNLASQLYHSSGLTWLVLKTDRIFLRICKTIDKRNPKAFIGVHETLIHLYENKILILGSTGGNAEVETHCLRKLGMLDFFTLIIGSDKAPKREHFSCFAKHLNLSLEEFASRTCLVSDGPVDLTLASKFGIYSIGITNTLSRRFLFQAGAKEVISDLRELLQ